MSADAGPSRKSPYKGLMPYDESDADFFFGRTREVRLVVANLFAAPATVLAGVSGVGKSSMLRAGVLSELATRSNILPAICSSWRDEPSAQVRHPPGRGDGTRPQYRRRLTGVRAGATLRDEVRLLSRRANRHIMIDPRPVRGILPLPSALTSLPRRARGRRQQLRARPVRSPGRRNGRRG